MTGITLSQEQYARAQQRALERGRAKDAIFRLEDYRDVDRPLRSHRVGRHVRARRRRLLRHVLPQVRPAPRLTTASFFCTRSGAAALRASPIPGSPNTSFREATSPRSRKCCRPSNAPRLMVTDVEILQLHYAETLKAWRERFLAHREDVERLYDAALRAHVGILSGILRDGVPRERHGGVPDPDGQAQRRRAGRRAITSGARKRGCATSKPAIPRRCA